MGGLLELRVEPRVCMEWKIHLGEWRAGKGELIVGRMEWMTPCLRLKNDMFDCAPGDHQDQAFNLKTYSRGDLVRR